MFPRGLFKSTAGEAGGGGGGGGGGLVGLRSNPAIKDNLKIHSKCGT